MAGVRRSPYLADSCCLYSTSEEGVRKASERRDQRINRHEKPSKSHRTDASFCFCVCLQIILSDILETSFCSTRHLNTGPVSSSSTVTRNRTHPTYVTITHHHPRKKEQGDPTTRPTLFFPLSRLTVAAGFCHRWVLRWSEAFTQMRSPRWSGKTSGPATPSGTRRRNR